MLRYLALIFCGIAVVATAPAYAQSSAQGELNVQAVVQGSVALVNVDGEWKVIVANAPDRAETHGSLQASSQHRAAAQARNHSDSYVKELPRTRTKNTAISPR
ncbi:MAG TPA: hypothetical protein VJN64_12670 [Terriglobales bacterium]|nr:hypothetical protein [Terriglobales bacterium]